jgi:ribosomal protein S18 acetylase RimI-like enzyme
MGFTKDNCPNHFAFITEERVLEQLNKENAFCFGIQDNGVWIGFVAVAPYGEGYEITRLAVAPDNRHKGYGRALMDTACNKARKLGLTSIGLGTLYENNVLIKWYESQGYVAGEPFVPEGAFYIVCGMRKCL